MNGQGATRRLGRATALGLVLAAALPAAAAARVVEPISVTKSRTVPAGETRSLSLKCPARAVAINGALESGLEAASSIPAANARSWSFRVTAGASARRAEAVLRCVRLRLPRRVRGVGLAVETRIEPVFEIAPGGSAQLRMRCSRGQVPTGWGLERSGEDNGLSIAEAMPTRAGWSFTVENVGTRGAAGTLHIRCLERRQRAESGQRHAFDTRVASFDDRAGGGATEHSCRRSEFSVATGISLPLAAGVRLEATGPVGMRGGEWSFARPGSSAVETSLVCLSRTTRFRG